MRLQLALAVILTGSVAHGDGALTARGAYYKEKATRVVQPMLDGLFEAGERGLVNGHFLVDAITSASQSAGAVNASAFTENRLEGGLGYTHLLDMADGARVGTSGKYSTESDYKSYYVGVRGEIDLFEKNTTLGVGAGFGHDTISGGAEGGLGQIMLECEQGKPDQPSCELDTYNLFATASQIVSKAAVVGLTYDLAALRGYQSNPYRSAIVGMNTERETHPTERTRHAVALVGRYYVAQTDTALIAQYRWYTDDWLTKGAIGAGAHTPELRIVQQIGDTADAALRYRFHTQRDAYFYKERYAMTPTDGLLSDDVKLSAFRSHTVEAKFGILGETFGLSGRWAPVRIEAILTYIAQDNRFGNAFVANAAVTLPFEY
ncbi:MAG TPA: DUF3570 domain-containing protein [Kofleriaceae bacterium]|nr:DUF3570 domain-containing protein [Kofleriaceae bacterium]